jgi:two-component system response regulator DegU
MIKLLIVDDHDVVREGLKQILEVKSDLKVIGVVSNGFECLDYLERHERPDIIFMDIKMPGLSGVQTTQLISQKFPEIKIIMLTVYDDQQYITQAIQAGAKGYVLKNSKRSDLIDAVNQVYKGNAFLDQTLTPMVFSSIKLSSTDKTFTSKPILTKRELEVLSCIVEGLSDHGIAETLFISNHTVRTHTKNIYRKLLVTSRSQAVVKALKDGLIEKT